MTDIEKMNQTALWRHLADYYHDQGIAAHHIVDAIYFRMGELDQEYWMPAWSRVLPWLAVALCLAMIGGLL